MKELMFYLGIALLLAILLSFPLYSAMEKTAERHGFPNSSDCEYYAMRAEQSFGYFPKMEYLKMEENCILKKNSQAHHDVVGSEE